MCLEEPNETLYLLKAYEIVQLNLQLCGLHVRGYLGIVTILDPHSSLSSTF